MGFVKFKGMGRGYIPKFSIWKSGSIGFNSGAVKKFKINEYGFAVLFYDTEERKIGVRFTNEQEEGALKVIKGKDSAYISSKAFMFHFGIPHEKTVRYEAEYDKENNLYVIMLNASEE